ncbi:Adaptive-response sensory-kinase SasA [Thiorhodovibrio winogradskyi]|uniref:histidine kinase n=1 Tax=Thiorhodovibrio winogradskyi TaxID=77007 RepID=A0ABZ0SEB0_9GAMM|nr:sensor histidine kinase [Thiorhodovibrio winogradskyi]
MKEIEITRPLQLDRSQIVALDTHSFLNILNVLNLELSNIAELCSMENVLQNHIDRLFVLANEMSNPDTAYVRIAGLDQDMAAIEQQINEHLSTQPVLRDSARVRDALESLDSIFLVLRKRIADLKARIDELTSWREFDIARVLEDFQAVFGAIEKNSKGRFRFTNNIAAQESRDYYLDFKIHSSEDPLIRMPAALIDVARDLLANARKYTSPGGRINAGIWSDDSQLCISVEDSGRGIPEDEIEFVIDYGHRASNVQDRRTMGGGLGLTKAYFICTQLGGRFWIRSELGRGTRIRIIIPKTADTIHDCPGDAATETS